MWLLGSIKLRQLCRILRSRHHYENADLVQGCYVYLVQRHIDVTVALPMKHLAQNVHNAMIDMVRKECGRKGVVTERSKKTAFRRAHHVTVDDCARELRGADTMKSIEDHETAGLVRQSLGQLDPRARIVILEYYWGEHSLGDIGKMLGVVESRVCQLHRAALRTLQVALPPRVDVGI